MIVNIELRGGTANTFPPFTTDNPPWVPIDQTTFQVNNDRRTACAYRVAGASEPASYTFALGSNVGNRAAAIVAFRGVDNATPLDVTGSYGTCLAPGCPTTISAPAITTVTDNAAVMMLVATEENNTVSNFSTTSPGPLTQLYGTTGGQGTIGAGWATKPTAGDTGTGTATMTTAGTTRWAGILIALKPAP